MEHPLSDPQILASGSSSGHTPTASHSHATGSALDLRTSSLLDPAKMLLHGGDMRRRGSDISRVRPVITADIPEEVELATLSRRRSADLAIGQSVDPSFADLESATGSKASIRQAAIGIEDVSVVDSTLSPEERKRQKRRAIQCFFALCWSFFMCGWNDGSTGPLLPTIQAHYKVIILLIFSTTGHSPMLFSFRSDLR